MNISFLTPIYNEEKFLPKLFKQIEKNYNNFNFEWIFVDDNSTDKSYEILNEFSKNKDKIILIKNNGSGKLDALNNGFKKTKGKFIKLVGGDDEIDLEIIKELDFTDENITYVHNAKILNENDDSIGNYTPPYQLFNYNLSEYLLSNISCPSWCWIFSRKIGEIFFPMPDCKYEDLYMSFCLKKFSKIKFINKSFYSYRQNYGQTFGHILKFNDGIGKFRYKRSFQSLSVIKKCKLFSSREKFLISISRLYYYFYLKKKNIFIILFSTLPVQRKLKLIIFKYLSNFYGPIQKLKYVFDKSFLTNFLTKKVKEKNLNLKKEIEYGNIVNKKLVLLKSCLSFPTKDGFTNQYYNFLNYFCGENQNKLFLFCNKNFDQKKFYDSNKNIKDATLIKNFPENFPILIIKLLSLIILHKLGFKNKIFMELENISKNTDFNFYIHDISLYPILFLNIDPKKIIFSITDFQINRLFKLIFVSKKTFKSFYYFLGFIHCLLVETLTFRKVKYLHVYSEKDRYNINKYLLYKNVISIPNFFEGREKFYTKNNILKINNNKILIMGDLNLPEVYNGLKKLGKIQKFELLSEKFKFVFKGNYSENIKQEIKKIFKHCEFNSEWFNKENYYHYLDSFKVLLFLDSIDFGLSNRVLDALNSKTLIVGFKSAFTGYPLKNYENVILLRNFNDLIKAINIDSNRELEIISNANKLANNYKISVVKSLWNRVL